jgi:hypothetical protein
VFLDLDFIRPADSTGGTLNPIAKSVRPSFGQAANDHRYEEGFNAEDVEDAEKCVFHNQFARAAPVDLSRHHDDMIFSSLRSSASSALKKISTRFRPGYADRDAAVQNSQSRPAGESWLHVGSSPDRSGPCTAAVVCPRLPGPIRLSPVDADMAASGQRG